MANMSYCRFQNTLRDLSDCYDNMEDADLGDDEKVARRRLVQMCHEISSNYIEDGVPTF